MRFLSYSGSCCYHRTRNLLQEQGQKQYMDNMFPPYNFYGFIVLHIKMYAANIYYIQAFMSLHCFVLKFFKASSSTSVNKVQQWQPSSSLT
ncbi:hypothetical protein Bca101_044764 [Brassica carinata]